MPSKGDFHLFDKNGVAILRVIRQKYPDDLHDHMNDLATALYQKQVSKHINKKVDNREKSFQGSNRYYSVHLYEQDKKKPVKNYRFVNVPITHA